MSASEGSSVSTFRSTPTPQGLTQCLPQLDTHKDKRRGKGYGRKKEAGQEDRGQQSHSTEKGLGGPGGGRSPETTGNLGLPTMAIA